MRPHVFLLFTGISVVVAHPLLAAAPAAFEAYPVPFLFSGRPAQVQLSTPCARTYRTRLRADAREGPSFAGHLTVISYGCGAGCVRLDLVDAETGRVSQPPFDTLITWPCGDRDSPNPNLEPVEYRRGSRMLVLKGTTGPDKACYAHDFVWERNQLHEIDKQPFP